MLSDFFFFAQLFDFLTDDYLRQGLNTGNDWNNCSGIVRKRPCFLSLYDEELDEENKVRENILKIMFDHSCDLKSIKFSRIFPKKRNEFLENNF